MCKLKDQGGPHREEETEPVERPLRERCAAVAALRKRLLLHHQQAQTVILETLGELFSGGEGGLAATVSGTAASSSFGRSDDIWSTRARVNRSARQGLRLAAKRDGGRTTARAARFAFFRPLVASEPPACANIPFSQVTSGSEK